MKTIRLLSACLALTACASQHPAARTSTVAAPPAVKLYTIDCGHVQASDFGSMADDGSMKGVGGEGVNPCYLIRHPKGDLLWDTGFAEAIADMPGGMQPQGAPMRFEVPKKLTAQLGELGLAPADIDFLSFSHMHFDHAGNANLFASAKWIVDAEELAAAFSETARERGEIPHYSALEHVKPVVIEGDGAYDVFGDGTVTIHQAPGHTPGHTVLLLKTAKSGAILLTGDLWPLRESRERHLVPIYNSNREQTLESMRRVEALAKESNARVIQQHVPEHFAALPAFPAPLE
ncbi:N-acyl homoserine lactonase family protein [Corallococcus llansteffanensis]|uniref:N-acyl homoserine lactonase family protein n=1 Tax=Corallococcus llansteffanensis TaxID=2316731 RepID=A0A3A8PDT4_9BACT|nr:N-acyl homoserine lactonase family protein [Corallococcus llansteffanensis]RKH52741.1 N-acyl homoserine lactonase family protein [Corallococcus llansteffanensis]